MNKVFFPINADALFIGITSHLVIVLGLLLALLIFKYIKRLELHLYTQIVIFSVAYIVHGSLFFLFYPHISLPIWLIICIALWNYPSNTVVINNFYRGVNKSIKSSKPLSKIDRRIAMHITNPINLQNDTISNNLKIAAGQIRNRKKKVIKLKHFPPLSILSIGVVVPAIYCLAFRTSMYEEFNSLYFNLFENYVVLTGLTYIFSLIIKYGFVENTHSKYFRDSLIKYVFWLFVIIIYIGSTVMIVDGFKNSYY